VVQHRSPLRVVRVPLLLALSALSIAACGDKKASDSSAVVASSIAPSLATPAPVTLAATTVAPTTIATIPPTTIPPTTTTVAPQNTIVHGAGPILTAVNGTAIDADVAATAQAIYTAAVNRDYAGIKTIIGDRRFRWGFVGQRRPAEEWQKEFDDGGDDALARMVALLDMAPTIDKRGNVVWPYLAGKDPEEWDDADLVNLASLGFRPEDIEATRQKGIYKDFRLIIAPDGLWTAFGVGY
jgi:hypothetical protein